MQDKQFSEQNKTNSQIGQVDLNQDMNQSLKTINIIPIKESEKRLNKKFTLEHRNFFTLVEQFQQQIENQNSDILNISLQDLYDMSDEMKAIGQNRGFFYPAEKKRMKAIHKLIIHQEEKEKILLEQKRQNDSVQKLMNKKPLFQRIITSYEQSYNSYLEQISELEKRKEILAEIRQMKKPIRLENIIEFGKKAEQLAQLKKGRNISISLNKTPDVYKSPIYKSQKKLLNQQKQIIQQQNLQKQQQQNIRKDYTQVIRQNTHIVTSQNNKQKLEELNKRYFCQFEMGPNGFKFKKLNNDVNKTTDEVQSVFSIENQVKMQLKVYEGPYKKGMTYLRSLKSSDQAKLKSKQSVDLNQPIINKKIDYLAQKRMTNPNQISLEILNQKRIDRVLNNPDITPLQKKELLASINESYDKKLDLQLEKERLIQGKLSPELQIERDLISIKQKIKLLQE